MLGSNFRNLLRSAFLAFFLVSCVDINQVVNAHPFSNLILDWKRFSSHKYLVRASRALSQGRYAEAEREASYVLKHHDSHSRQAKLILAESLLAQQRHANAVDALNELADEPLYKQIQLSWLNQPEPVPEYRIDEWLEQEPPGIHRQHLIQARAEQLKRYYGATTAWLWLQPQGGDVVYRSGLAELAEDWDAVVDELSSISKDDPRFTNLIEERLALAQATLNPPPLPPLSLDELSFRLIEFNYFEEALDLLEARLVRNNFANHSIPPALADRLINLYAQLGSPTASFLKSLAPLLPAYERGVLFEQLASQGECDLFPDLTLTSATTASPGEWFAYGECAISTKPGEASIYLQKALSLGRLDARSLLAFSLASSGEPARAYELWQSLPVSEQDQSSVQAGMAQVSLELDRLEIANKHWHRISRLGIDEWRMGGLIAAGLGDLDTAYERFMEVIAESQTASDFYQAGLLARANGNLAMARQWLKTANELDPDNFRYLSDYGFTLSTDPDPHVHDQALPVLLRASDISDANPEVEAEIAKHFKERRDIQSSLRYYKRAIELEQDPMSCTEPLDTPSQRQRIYGLKRNFETLSRRNYYLVDLTVSPYGSPETIDSFVIDDLLLEYQQGIVGSVRYDRKLFLDQKLFAYGRVISTSSLSEVEIQSSGGLGLRYQPFYNLNVNLYAEYFQGLLGNLEADDALFRLNGTILDQGNWSAEWKEDRDVWNERYFYFDTAFFVEQSQSIGLYRYSQGRTWKLPGDGAQTLSPYLFSQMAFQDSEYDIRLGIGLRWQFWLDEDHFRAYRRRITTRFEFQQPLAGDLYQQTPGVRVSLQLNL